MSKHPTIENAPGLTWRPRKSGWEARWQARYDLVKRGYRPKSFAVLIVDAEPKDYEIAFIQSECQRQQDEMLAFGRGVPEVGAFDGTIASLVRCYQTDEDSSYRIARFKTREYYDTLCRMVMRDLGDKRICELTARDLLRWHGQYSDRIAMGHSVVGMLRTLCTFGATLLADRDCRELKTTLGDMRFKMPKARTERLTAAQAIAVRTTARYAGRFSIALAQALQYELTLRQKDVIGEWVPINEPGPLTSVVNGNAKWIRGLDWREIDQNWILKHVTSKRQKEIEVPLSIAQMVVEELGNLDRSAFPASGPVIVDEKKGLPYTTADFRRAWRAIADVAGIPRTVRNMDTRAGAITEALNSGAELENVRKAATHSDIGMTQKYSRGDAEAIAEVMKLRAAGRNKTGRTD